MMRFISFLNRHKTKISGGVMVVIGSVQAQAVIIQPFMSPKHFALFTIAAGGFVALLGFLNGQRNDPQ